MKKSHQTRKTPGGKEIRIQQVGSPIGRPEKQREILRGLGLRRMNHVVTREDTPEIRGMVRKIPHLAVILED